jgi:hypothetical protein
MDKGREVAASKREHPRKFRLDEFWWRARGTFERGMAVIQVIAEDKGRKMVTRPGTVVHTKKWTRNGKSVTFVYVEVPPGRAVRLERLTSRIGAEGVRRLKRGGIVTPELAAKLLKAWAN